MSKPTLNKRRPSFPSSAPENVLRNIDTPATIKPPMALIKHGKYVLAGVGGMWYTGFVDAVGSVLNIDRPWIRRLMVLALGFHASTVLIFLYLVLYLPWFRGYIPNYPKWQASARLRTLVPALTLSILLGWISYVIALSQAGKSSLIVEALKGNTTRGLGVFMSMAGATAAYAVTFGVLGFIPAPQVGRKD